MFSCQRSHLLLALLLTTALTMAVGSSAKPTGNAPTAPTSALLTPTSGVTAVSDLQVVASGSTDEDGDTVTYKYQWQSKAPAGGWTDIPLATMDTLTHPLTRDYEYRALVWAVSGFPEQQSLSSLDSNAVLVGDTPPSAPASLTISPALPFVSTDLTASYNPATDVDGDPLTYVVQWALSTDGGFTWGAWGDDGITLAALIPGTPPTRRFVRGQAWRARAFAFDGTVAGTERLSASVVIGNSLPTTSDTPTILPASPTSSTDLSVSSLAGTDLDGDEVTFRYQWARRNMDGFKAKGPAWGEWEDGGSTLSHTRLIRDDQWMVRVAPYDGIDYGAWVESAPVTIGNSVPTIPTAVTFDPTAPKTGDAITATATGATDMDGDLLTDASYQYRWLQSIDGGLTYSPTAFATNVLPEGSAVSGEWWTVETWANDGLDDGVHFTSAPVVIGNAVPSAPTVGLTPATPRSKDDLHALASDSVDPEGVPVTYGYRWLRSIDGGATWTVVSNPGGATLAAAKIKRGEVWKVQARATDGLAFGRWATSNLVTIGNTVPEISKVRWGITPTLPNVSDTLQAWASGATDRDGDAITYAYQWSVSGDGGATWSAWSEHTGQTLVGVTLVSGQVWRMRLRAEDSLGVSAWKTTPKSVTIVGKTPTAPAQVVIAPLSPTSSSDLTATASGSTDPDGDSITYLFEWALSTNGGRTWSAWGNPGATLDHTLITRSQLWKVRARASDGALLSGWVQSAAVEILNAAPATPTVDIAPLGPTPNQDLTATAHATDADGDTVTYVYEWSRSTNGGTTWDSWSSTGSVLTKDMTELRDKWRVRSMATDGTLSSDWAVSDPVTILGMFADQDPLPNAFSGPRDYLRFAFRQAVDEASAESSFSLSTAGGMPVAGTFSWTTPNLVMRFVPNVPLTMASSYSVTMASGVALIGGGTYDWTESFNFTSSSAPVVTAATPTGAGVPASRVVTVTFDQNMKKTSTLAAFSITPAVAGAPTLLGKTLTFTPTVGLAANTVYTVTVAKTALSSSGLPMHDAYSWTFTTAAAAPVSMSAAVARTAGGAQINVNLSAAAEVSVVICNVAGRVVAQLPGRALPAGVSTLLWNGRSSAGTAVPSGVYLVHVQGSSLDGGRSKCLTTLRQ